MYQRYRTQHQQQTTSPVTMACLMRKHLSADVRQQLKLSTTKYGASLIDLILAGVLVADQKIGIYLPDDDSYATFRPLLEAVFADLFGPLYSPGRPQFQPTMSPPELCDVDFPSDVMACVRSTRIRVARNLKGFRFPSTMELQERLEVETKVREALEGVDAEFQGTYNSLGDIPPERRDELVNQHLLFTDHDSTMTPLGFYDDWPQGRGFFMAHTACCDIIVWVNEEDHLRIIVMTSEPTPVSRLYACLYNFSKELEKTLTFAHDPELGFVASCPSNLGTGMRASLHLRLPVYSKRDDLKTTCKSFNLQARGEHGEGGKVTSDIVDISNADRYGIAETSALNSLVANVNSLMEKEKAAA